MYSLGEISKVTNSKLSGDKNYIIRQLLTDSRTLLSPENTLFFAISGVRHNGHHYLAELYKKGVRCFVVEKIPGNAELFEDCNWILTDNSIKALQRLCSFHRSKFSVPVIGITGSNGKTIVKEWLFQLLNEDKNTCRSPKSYNSQIGVPLSVWLMNNETEIGIFEAGISQEQEMHNLQSIIRPTIGVFTNIGDAHQENFKNQNRKAREKLKLFNDCSIMVYNKNYLMVDNLVRTNISFIGKTFTWSTTYPANLNIKRVEKREHLTEIYAEKNKEYISITIPFTDDASVENAIHCWCVMLILGYDNKTISQRMLKLLPVAMRLEIKAGSNNCTLVNDYYNSDITSLTIALDFLQQQSQHNEKVLILSDILQNNTDYKKLYTEVADLLAKKKIQTIVGIGEKISQYENLFTANKYFFNSTDEFIKKINELRFYNKAILLKGARAFEFEKISALLQQKTHATVMEINLNAIVHNLNYYRSLAGAETKIMAMVKAFSYGSGLYEIANILQYQKVNYLAVAYADEGAELRKSGITLPIMVMDPEEQCFEQLAEYNLEPELYSFRIIEQFKNFLTRNGLDKFPVHIKLDTGMHRLGFVKEDHEKLITELTYDSKFIIKSIFSHLAASDDNEFYEFTKSQIQTFTSFSDEIITKIKYPVLRHILNSSGIERYPEAIFDMVRLGIGLYGVSSHNQHKLQNVSTLKSCISQIKKLKAGETIGYNRKYKLEKDSVIATIAIGYADGINRKLGNKNGRVLINGKFAPLVGNICMDLCMADITEIDAKEGDYAVFFNDVYRINEIAEQTGTIPYEILTGISRRVKRIYFHE